MTIDTMHVAHHLAAAIISVFPCDNEKKPLCKWRADSTTRAVTIRRWWTQRWPQALIGIDLDKSDLIVIDADRHDADEDGVAALARLESEHEVLPDHPITLTANNGEHHYFRQPEGEKLGNGEGDLPDGINVRGSGGYVIAAGSVAGDWRWVANPDAPDLVESLQAGTIPVIPDWLVQIIKTPKALPIELPPEPEPEPIEPEPIEPVPAPKPRGPRQECFKGAGVREHAFAQAALDGLCRELAGMSKDSGRNNCLNSLAYRLGRLVSRGWLTGAAVESGLIEACSRNGLLNDDGQKQCRSTIRSGVNSGRRDPHPDLKDKDSERIVIALDGTSHDQETGEVIEDKRNENLSVSEIELEKLSHCPGLVGELVDWICCVSRRPSRILALGTALTVIGTLIGRRVAGPTRSATHLYVIGLAPTGAGKGSQIDAAKTLLTAAGAADHIGDGDYTVQSAFAGMIHDKPLALAVMDEFGAFLKRINRKNASGWEAGLSKIMREIWNLSFKRFDGTRKAQSKCEPIYCPAISILGLSVQDEFYSAINSGEMSNGFLNRCLVFSTKQTPNRNQNILDDSIVPQGIIDKMNALYVWNGAELDSGNLMRANYNPKPHVIKWSSDEAKRVHECFEDEMIQFMKKNERMDNFFGRCAEMAIRLATIRAAGRWVGTYNFTVDKSDITWGIEVAKASCLALAKEAGEMIHEDTLSHSRLISRIIEIIGTTKRISKSGLTRKLQRHAKGDEIRKSLDLLMDSHTIHQEVVTKSGHPTTYYAIHSEAA